MKISLQKREKICEQILSTLYLFSPKILFTSQIAEEIARDEEFVKRLLNDLQNKKLVKEIKKSPKGETYKKRSRWKLDERVYEVYNKQNQAK